jgi:hypothetical protein
LELLDRAPRFRPSSTPCDQRCRSASEKGANEFGAHDRAPGTYAVNLRTKKSILASAALADDRGRLRAWNNSLVAMLGVSGADLRPGTSLPLGNDANRVGQRVRELETAVRATGRPTLVEHREESGTAVEIFHNSMADRRLCNYPFGCDRAAAGRGGSASVAEARINGPDDRWDSTRLQQSPPAETARDFLAQFRARPRMQAKKLQTVRPVDLLPGRQWKLLKINVSESILSPSLPISYTPGVRHQRTGRLDSESKWQSFRFVTAYAATQY